MSKQLVMANNPIAVIESQTYKDQPIRRRMFREGYAYHFNKLYDLDKNPEKLSENRVVMQDIADQLSYENWVKQTQAMNPDFSRVIIGIEEREGQQESKEIVVAFWKKGQISPPHGHSEGWLYEHIIEGRIIVHTYSVHDLENKIVRPHLSEVHGAGELVSTFVPKGTHKVWKRESFIHSFEAVDDAVSVHFVPEHTRDGRDNTFVVQHFNLKEGEYTQITAKEAMYSQKGDVILVRSTNVPEYKDHYIIITGEPIMKPHGFRPQDVVVQASPLDTGLLNSKNMWNGTTLLKLNKKATQRFNDFHNLF